LDTSQSEWVTDLVLAIVCIVLLLGTLTAKGRASPMGECLLLLLFTFLAYACAGASRSKMYMYAQKGLVMGLNLGDPNSEWMIPWIGKVIFLPFSFAAIVSVANACVHLPAFSAWMVYGLAMVLGIYETYSIVVNDNTKETGKFDRSFGMVTSGVSVFLVVLGFCIKGCQGCTGRFCVLIGCALMLMGLSISDMMPGSCRETGVNRIGCPFPENFDQNAVKHVLVAFAIFLITVGCWIEKRSWIR